MAAAVKPLMPELTAEGIVPRPPSRPGVELYPDRCEACGAGLGPRPAWMHPTRGARHCEACVRTVAASCDCGWWWIGPAYARAWIGHCGQAVAERTGAWAERIHAEAERCQRDGFPGRPVPRPEGA